MKSKTNFEHPTFNFQRSTASTVGPADSVTTDRLSPVRVARGRRQSRVLLLAVQPSIVIRPSSILLFLTAQMQSPKHQQPRGPMRPARGAKHRHICHANPMPGRPVFRVRAASTGRHTDCTYNHFQIKKGPFVRGNLTCKKW
jgi:hypothetical protein